MADSKYVSFCTYYLNKQSQNSRIVEVRRDLWRWSSPTLPGQCEVS